jgi:hypothetical protein
MASDGDFCCHSLLRCQWLETVISSRQRLTEGHLEDVVALGEGFIQLNSSVGGGEHDFRSFYIPLSLKSNPLGLFHCSHPKKIPRKKHSL